jgi:hypothetical protein
MDSSDRFCNRLLVKGVRVRSDHAKGIANHALKWNRSRVMGHAEVDRCGRVADDPTGTSFFASYNPDSGPRYQGCRGLTR